MHVCSIIKMDMEVRKMIGKEMGNVCIDSSILIEVDTCKLKLNLS